MSYSITLRIYQTNPDRGYYHNVERTCWYFANGGTWTESDGKYTLNMGGSGTSGVLRFRSNKQDELVTIAVGVHNHKRWCDVAPALKAEETALFVNGQYYNDGPRSYMREKQLSNYSVTSPLTGAKMSIVYTVAEGNNLEAYVIIG